MLTAYAHSPDLRDLSAFFQPLRDQEMFARPNILRSPEGEVGRGALQRDWGSLILEEQSRDEGADRVTKGPGDLWLSNGIEDLLDP